MRYEVAKYGKSVLVFAGLNSHKTLFKAIVLEMYSVLQVFAFQVQFHGKMQKGTPPQLNQLRQGVKQRGHLA